MNCDEKLNAFFRRLPKIDECQEDVNKMKGTLIRTSTRVDNIEIMSSYQCDKIMQLTYGMIDLDAKEIKRTLIIYKLEKMRKRAPHLFSGEVDLVMQYAKFKTQAIFSRL
jgi:hypothetical protein